MMGGRKATDMAGLRQALRAAAEYRPDPERPPTLLRLPFTGSWVAGNTPAARVPSHGTHFGGQTYAIDFVPVDERARTDVSRDWRTVLATEPVERFVGFGRPILAPAEGRVVAVFQGEPDHRARRSPLAVLPYALSQGSRLRKGPEAVVGNHVILELAEGYVLLAHLRAGSVEVRSGDLVSPGRPLASCGNSGNSTQPHLHLQVMDSPDLLTARGIPVAFRDYLAWSPGASAPRRVAVGVPGRRERVAPAPPEPGSGGAAA
jgi:hypothetical protein